jgi:D-glycerate 3-kinase
MSVLSRWPKEQLCLTNARREEVVRVVERAFASALASLKVDIGLVAMFEAIYVPLGSWLYCRKQQQEGPLVIGINGAQGAGKSTLFNLIEVILSEAFDLKVVGFSLDDLYKTREERERLAKEVHPLLLTRGVPGTHDVQLGIDIIESLKRADPMQPTKIPVFDKSIDDRCPETIWQEWLGPADVIVFEGWCVGAVPQSDADLQSPINELEANEDPEGEWRRYANEQLAGPYQALFECLDLLIMLKVPSMEAVYEWRSLQEKKLAERVKYIFDTQQPTDHLRIMNEQEILRFIQHYERLTRHMLDEMPNRADVTLKLNENHKISEIQINTPLECLEDFKEAETAVSE